MKPAFILKNPAARSVIFASFMIFGMVNLSDAQTGSTAEQPSTGWGDTLPGNGNPSPRQEGAPDQVGSSGGSSAEQSGSCRYMTPDQETFLCKLIRIFYGPDTPPGPNRDIDNNISAGGAGG